MYGVRQSGKSSCFNEDTHRRVIQSVALELGKKLQEMTATGSDEVDHGVFL